MILRPPDDAGLLALISEVLCNEVLPLDTRALLAALLARRDLENCPYRITLTQTFGDEFGEPLGQFRISRMLSDAIRSGYMTRATWRVPHHGKRPAYSFAIGSREAIADLLKTVSLRSAERDA
jgi:hypothetical protein